MIIITIIRISLTSTILANILEITRDEDGLPFIMTKTPFSPQGIKNQTSNENQIRNNNNNNKILLINNNFPKINYIQRNFNVINNEVTLRNNSIINLNISRYNSLSNLNNNISRNNSVISLSKNINIVAFSPPSS